MDPISTYGVQNSEVLEDTTNNLSLASYLPARHQRWTCAKVISPTHTPAGWGLQLSAGAEEDDQGGCAHTGRRPVQGGPRSLGGLRVPGLLPQRREDPAHRLPQLSRSLLPVWGPRSRAHHGAAAELFSVVLRAPGKGKGALSDLPQPR